MGNYLVKSRASAAQEGDVMLYRAAEAVATDERWRRRPSYGERMMARMATPFGGSSYLSQGWRDNRVAQVRHWNGWAYVAGHKLATMAACQQPICSWVLPAERHKKTGRYAYKHLYGDYRRKAAGSLKPHEDLEPLPADHGLVELFEDPNGSSDTAFDLWYETVMFLILTGSAYWWLPRDGWNLPGEIWVLPSHWVWPVVAAEVKDRDKLDWYEDTGLVSEYEIRPVYGGYGMYRFPAGDIVHLRWKNPISKLDGYAPLTGGSRWVDQAEMIDGAQWESFRSGPFPGGTLELPQDMDDPAQEDIDRIQAKFSNKFQGYEKAGRVIVLKSGMKYTPLNISPREMDFGTSMDSVRDKVLAIIGMNKAYIGITQEVSRAAADSAIYVVGKTTLNPMFTMIDQCLTKNVARRYKNGDRIRIWHMDTSNEDPDFRLRENQADLQTGVKTINEVRQDRGLEPYPHGGDDPLLTAGLVPMPFVSGEDIDLSAIVSAAQQAQQASQQIQQAQQPQQPGGGAGPGGAPGLPAPGGEQPPTVQPPPEVPPSSGPGEGPGEAEPLDIGGLLAGKMRRRRSGVEKKMRGGRA